MLPYVFPHADTSCKTTDLWEQPWKVWNFHISDQTDHWLELIILTMEPKDHIY